MSWGKIARSQRVAPEMSTGGVAPLARTISTVLRVAPYRQPFQGATRLAINVEIGSCYSM